MAMPSSSLGPEVICSGWPSGKRCLQVWKVPPALELKYIHLPSGGQAAKVQPASGGPTCRPAELPSKGTSLQGSHAARSISTTSAHLPSGEGYDRCAIPSLPAGTLISRCPARLSSAATRAIWKRLSLISENRILSLLDHTNPEALGSQS